MRKLAAFATVAALCVVGSAQAHKTKPPSSPTPTPPTSPAPAKEHGHKVPTGPTQPSTPVPTECVAHSEGFKASGTLVSAALTVQPNGRYNGTLQVTVTKANHHHHAPTSETVTYTLTNARVKFHHGVSAAAPAAGSRVKLGGKITELPGGCSTTGFTPTVTIAKADIKAAKH
jgi:hypothetical protein